MAHGRPHWQGLFSLLEKVSGISKKVRPYQLFEALGEFAVIRAAVGTYRDEHVIGSQKGRLEVVSNDSLPRNPAQLTKEKPFIEKIHLLEMISPPLRLIYQRSSRVLDLLILTPALTHIGTADFQLRSSTCRWPGPTGDIRRDGP